MNVKADTVVKQSEEAEKRVAMVQQPDIAAQRKQRLRKKRNERLQFLQRHGIKFPGDPLATLCCEKRMK